MPERVRFFPGQLLTASDFELEQTYQLKMRRLHNQFLHGSGVVEGLSVFINGGSPDSAAVAPGFALDRFGREIIVDAAAQLSLGKWPDDVVFVTLAYGESEIDPIPLPDSRTEFSRIKEGFLIATSKEDPQKNATTEALGLARLNRQKGLWQVDGTYRLKRVKTTR
jgi:hypothetical protein